MKKGVWWLVGGVVLIVAVLTAVFLILFQSHELDLKEAQKQIEDEMQKTFEGFAESDDYIIQKLSESSRITVKALHNTDGKVMRDVSIGSLAVGDPLIQLLEELQGQVVDDDTYRKKVEAAVDSAKWEETLCEMTFVQSENGGWQLDEVSYEVYDAYLGGYLTYAQKAVEQMQEELQ